MQYFFCPLYVCNSTYSNIYSSYQLKYGSTNSIAYNGDINAGVSSPNPIGEPDFGFRYPVCNSGAFFGYFSVLASGSTPTIGSSFGETEQALVVNQILIITKRVYTKFTRQVAEQITTSQ